MYSVGALNFWRFVERRPCKTREKRGGRSAGCTGSVSLPGSILEARFYPVPFVPFLSIDESNESSFEITLSNLIPDF